jgi:hypothetical protein
MRFANQFIKNLHKRNCFECIYYKPSFLGTDIARCSKFGDKNIVDGKVKYESTWVSRFDNKKCGEQGRYFETNYRYTVWKNQIVENIPFIVAITSIVVYCGIGFYLVSNR